MTAQQLKNSILQMAVQGKLVPQDPNDEPASVLLERIKAEKQELINAGKIKKDKKSSEIFRGASRNLPYAFCEQIGKEIHDISDEIPFDIPDSWEWVRNKDVMRFINGRAYKKPELLSSGKYRILRVGNFFTNDNWYYSDLELDEDKYCDVGDLLYAWSASFGPKIWEGEKVIYHYHIWKLDYIAPIYRDYLYYYLLADTVRIRNLSHGLGFVFVTKEFMENRLIPIPPLAEQHRIVAKIEELLPYIEKYGKAEEHLSALNTTFPDALKKSILQEAVQGKLVPQNPDDEPASVLLERIRTEKQALIKAGKIKKDKHESVIVTRDKIPYEIIDGNERCIADEVPFELPESWEWVTLGQIVLSVADGPHFSPQYQNDGIPFISTRNIATGKLDFSSAKFISPELHNELCKRCKPRKGDILYSKGGTTGIAAVNDSDIEFNVWVHVAVLSTSSYIFPYYLAMALNSPHCYEQSQKYTHGTGNRDLGLTRMVKITLPLPPLEEQKRIVAKIEEIMPIISTI